MIVYSLIPLFSMIVPIRYHIIPILIIYVSLILILDFLFTKPITILLSLSFPISLIGHQLDSFIFTKQNLFPSQCPLLLLILVIKLYKLIMIILDYLMFIVSLVCYCLLPFINFLFGIHIKLIVIVFIKGFQIRQFFIMPYIYHFQDLLFLLDNQIIIICILIQVIPFNLLNLVLAILIF